MSVNEQANSDCGKVDKMMGKFSIKDNLGVLAILLIPLFIGIIIDSAFRYYQQKQYDGTNVSMDDTWVLAIIQYNIEDIDRSYPEYVVDMNAPDYVEFDCNSYDIKSLEEIWDQTETTNEDVNMVLEDFNNIQAGD